MIFLSKKTLNKHIKSKIYKNTHAALENLYYLKYKIITYFEKEILQLKNELEKKNEIIANFILKESEK